MPDAARVGLLGHGTVGSAFATLLAERAEAIGAASGRRPELVGILRALRATSTRSSSSSEVVVELIGGTDPARDYVLRALGSGRHVVTANKQLVAQHGDELFAAAREAGVQLRFEAAVAGVVPVIRVIQESLATTEITKVFGIVNGTTNFILSEMASTGASYADALARGPGARLRRGRPERRRGRRGRRGEDGDPRAARLPHAGRARRRLLRGHHGHPARRPGLREGARALAEAARAWPSGSRAGSASACIPASSTRATRWRRCRDRSTP